VALDYSNNVILRGRQSLAAHSSNYFRRNQLEGGSSVDVKIYGVMGSTLISAQLSFFMDDKIPYLVKSSQFGIQLRLEKAELDVSLYHV